MKKLAGILLLMAGLSGAAVADGVSLSFSLGDRCYRPYYRSHDYYYRTPVVVYRGYSSYDYPRYRHYSYDGDRRHRHHRNCHHR